MKPIPKTISWIAAAKKQFEKFPETVQEDALAALEIAAVGEKADIAKPLQGLGAGVLEIAQKYRGNAYRTVYALKIGDEIWVVHAFQKKSTTGIKTPKKEIDLVVARIKALKVKLRELKEKRK